MREKSQISSLLKRYRRLTEIFILNKIYLLKQQGIQRQVYALLHPQEPHNHPQEKQIKTSAHYISDFSCRLPQIDNVQTSFNRV